MTTTINEDVFDKGDAVTPVEPHHILYGFDGHTDEVDVYTLEVLWSIGAIELRGTVEGNGTVTHIYVSRAGVVPNV